MDKKIGKHSKLFFLFLSIALFQYNYCVASIRYTFENMNQQGIQHAEIGVPFFFKLILEDIDPIGEPKGFDESIDIHFYGKTKSIININGKINEHTTLTYLVTPHAKGILKLGVISVQDKHNNSVKTDPIMISVKDIKTPQYDGKQAYVLVVEADQKSVYIGQKVKIYIKFCYLEKFQDLSFKNIGINDVDIGYQEQHLQDSTITLGGVLYNCKQMCCEIYPKKIGTIVIPSFAATFMPEQLQSVSSLFLFSHFNMVQSHPYALEVLSLPDHDEYKHVTAIGNFDTVKFEINKKQSKVGEGITAQMIVEGNGNLEIVQAPELQIPKEINFYEGNNSLNRIDQQKEQKTFQWILQAQTPGTYQIPEQKFTFFDLTTKKYKTIKTKPLNIIIEGVTVSSSESNDIGPNSIIEHEDQKVVNDSSAIDYIPQIKTVSSSGFDFLSNTLSWIVILFLCMILLCVVLIFLKPYIVKIFWIQSLQYRWLFWKYSRENNVQGIYQLFEKLSMRYNFGLQSYELQQCFEKLNLSEESFENWKNFIHMLLEFNFTSNISDEDRQIVLNLAKQWFPIIISCCRVQHKNHN